MSAASDCVGTLHRGRYDGISQRNLPMHASDQSRESLNPDRIRISHCAPGLVTGLAAMLLTLACPLVSPALADDAQWVSFGSQLSGSNITCMAVYDNKLIVGGSFNSPGGIPTARIASWDG